MQRPASIGVELYQERAREMPQASARVAITIAKYAGDKSRIASLKASTKLNVPAVSRNVSY